MRVIEQGACHRLRRNLGQIAHLYERGSKYRNLSAKRLADGLRRRQLIDHVIIGARGEMAEWSIAPDSKSGLGKPNGGSNPSLSASFRVSDRFFLFCRTTFLLRFLKQPSRIIDAEIILDRYR